MSYLWGITSEILHGSTRGMAFLLWLLLPSLSRKLLLLWEPCSYLGWQRAQGLNHRTGVSQETLLIIRLCAFNFIRADTAPFLIILFVLQTISKLNIFILYLQANSMML